MTGTWWAILSAAEALWVAVVAVWILFERRSPAATIAWILALAALPVVGLAVYYVVGPRRFDRKKVHRAFARAAAREAAELACRVEPKLLDVPAHFAALGEAASGEAGRPRHATVELFFDGVVAYEKIVEAIASAVHHVHLEYYIWQPDHIGTRIRDALVERAKHGVEVRILIDGFGSSAANTAFWKPLTDEGGRVHRFNALTPRRLRPRLANFRTHRKIVVVDGLVGFTGGMNVTDVHTSEFSGEKAWRDTHARVEGEGVQGLQLVFCESWHDVCDELLDGVEYFPRDQSPLPGERVVQVMASGPDENFNVIHKLVVSSISSARKRVLLTAPYFVPDESLLTALTTAALGGIDVRVLVPAKNDLRLVSAASRSYYPALLQHGVRIFEYGPPMLHAKTLVVDDELAVVGTANADARSYLLNFEVILACYDEASADRLAEVFRSDLEHALEVREEDVDAYLFHQRLFQNFARLFSPTL